MFKKIFSGHNIIGEHCHRMPPWLRTGLHSKSFALGWKYCCIM